MSDTPPPTPAPADELITAYDAYGRELRISRADWRDKVLLPQLQRHWDDADELYRLLISGLNDGLAADLQPAAARLVQIDANPERSHTVEGIVYLRNDLLEQAEATLRAGIEQAGPTGTLLTNLAKVYAARGEQARADETLWRAVQADPNQDNGLLWWAVRQRERGGEDAYLAALREAAKLPGSWRARLWLARHHLQQREVDAARQLYTEVLATGRYDGASLMMISGDLGKHGELGLMLQLIAPVYDEHRHDPMAGLNLLRAYQQLGLVEPGEALLARLYALDVAPLKARLDGFAQAFQEMRARSAPATPVDPRQLRFGTIALDRPIWHYGLRDPDWLFRGKPADAPAIGFVALGRSMDEAQQAQVQREDEMGRLTRSIPLYLAEAVHFWSDYAAHCYVPVVTGGGPVVSGAETDTRALFDTLPGGMRFVVTGMIGGNLDEQPGRWVLRLDLWDCRNRSRHATESATGNRNEFGALLRDLEIRLLERIGLARGRPLDAFYSRPAPQALPRHLAALGQSFTLTLVADEQLPKSALWGERSMLEWPLGMALQDPTAQVPGLLYLSGLSKAAAYGSELLPQLRQPSLQLLLDTRPADAAFARLAPLLWKVFGMEEAWQAHLRQLPTGADGRYRAWLDRVAGQRG